jgi:hypothetical protein
MNGCPQPELRRVQKHLEGLSPVEVAFRAVACLDDAQREAFTTRFNAVFGKCTPPLLVAFRAPQQ